MQRGRGDQVATSLFFFFFSLKQPKWRWEQIDSSVIWHKVKTIQSHRSRKNTVTWRRRSTFGHNHTHTRTHTLTHTNTHAVRGGRRAEFVSQDVRKQKKEKGKKKAFTIVIWPLKASHKTHMYTYTHAHIQGLSWSSPLCFIENVHTKLHRKKKKGLRSLLTGRRKLCKRSRVFKACSATPT